MRRWCSGAVAALIAAAVVTAGADGVRAAADVPQPDGFRAEPYRAPVPDGLDGARVLDTPAVAALWKAGGAVFVDVLPKPPRPKLPPGTVFRLPPREDIPGSVWLPDVGYAELSADMARYFTDNLAAATKGDHARTLVFYCLADCWMSWNAAKRALSLGYTDVVWYPEGTDGWGFEGLPVEAREPVPRPGLDE
ncbi:rhodanese-like domain-containing protein [Oharaeibacter diazotrophicus]|uniref:PQQ-dependent catabolism-associated CXXCW motif protein n=1 Tax=Oharaeibacter diazotrophicus TaxID=1920512 RepID=A0A4R6RM02_9HYPH|nr:rhodanese-like domain-containing protein [Oharaeibacter diazotrophicus]TDP87552.1 PQQ-dependent catabolism-associated CXXCW motif protein [Oharaeibacter diazotrophicus]BBE70503.1 rhodanese [Pleomorphomonas sp. SM30]